MNLQAVNTRPLAGVVSALRASIFSALRASVKGLRASVSRFALDLLSRPFGPLSAVFIALRARILSALAGLCLRSFISIRQVALSLPKTLPGSTRVPMPSLVLIDRPSRSAGHRRQTDKQTDKQTYRLLLCRFVFIIYIEVWLLSKRQPQTVLSLAFNFYLVALLISLDCGLFFVIVMNPLCILCHVAIMYVQKSYLFVTSGLEVK